MKVVINTCYGGFNLSDAAFELLLDKKGIEYEKIKSKYDSSMYYEKGHVKENDFYLSPYALCGDRSDPHLIEVIEELGHKANGYAAHLKIVEIPEGVEWYVHDYDGLEHVAETHRVWG